MNDFEITLKGRPTAKERPRRSAYGVMYTPKKTTEAEKKIAEKIKDKVDWVSDKDIKLDLVFYFTKKPLPDIDNLSKLVMDSINRSKVIWKDDKQVTYITARRIYNKEEIDRTEISIEILDF